MKKYLVLAVVLILAGIAIWTGRNRYYAASFRTQAVDRLKNGDFQGARVFAERSLQYAQRDPETLLVFSEAVYKDPSLPEDKRLRLALDSLSNIRDNAINGYQARVNEASILFFNQKMPVAAELSLQRAARQDPSRHEAWQSLFQIYCCTGRETLTESLFQKMLETSTGRLQKTDVLKAWFASQFALSAFNQRTDEQLQTEQIAPGSIPTSQKRLLMFRQAEPDQPMAQTALAYWFYLRRDPVQAKKLLDEMDPGMINPADPHFLMAAVNIYFESGDIELAKSLHEGWDDESWFEYWRQQGVIQQDFGTEYGNAILAYEKALQIWPGPIDPSVYFRLETCLRRVNRQNDAAAYLQRATEMKQVTDLEQIKELLRRMGTGPVDGETCRALAQFYKKLGRDYERRHWLELAESADNG